MTATVNATGVSTWTIDPSHSQSEFAVKHMMFSTVKGSFTGISGEIHLDEENLADSRVIVEIDASSVTTRDEKRDEHLRSADFFNVEQYPSLRFESTEVVPESADRFRLLGNLTIGAITRPVEIQAQKNGVGVNPYGATVAGFEGTTKINRKDFELNWNVALEAGGFLVGEEVKIHLEVQAMRQ